MSAWANILLSACSFSVKVNDIEEEALEIFNKLKSEKGIKDENVNFIVIGNEIILFPKYIIHPTCKPIIRKQINSFTISFSMNNLLYNP